MCSCLVWSPQFYILFGFYWSKGINWAWEKKKTLSKLCLEIFPNDVPPSNVICKMLASAFLAESEMAFLCIIRLLCLYAWNSSALLSPLGGIGRGLVELHRWKKELPFKNLKWNISLCPAPDFCVPPLNLLVKTVAYVVCLCNYWKFTRICAVMLHLSSQFLIVIIITNHSKNWILGSPPWKFRDLKF